MSPWAVRMRLGAVLAAGYLCLSLLACTPEQPWQRHRLEWEEAARGALADGVPVARLQVAGGFVLEVDEGPPMLAALTSDDGLVLLLFDPEAQLPTVTKLPSSDPRTYGFRRLYGRGLDTCSQLAVQWYDCPVSY